MQSSPRGKSPSSPSIPSRQICKVSVGKAQSLIEPMLTLFMGALLGWIMLSVIGPIYDVISKIKT